MNITPMPWRIASSGSGGEFTIMSTLRCSREASIAVPPPTASTDASLPGGTRPAG